MKSRIYAAAAAMLLGASLACRDPMHVTANQSVSTVGLIAYALSGTPPSYPSAIYTPTPAIARPDGGLLFDVALDLDATGKVVLLPVQLIGDASVAGRQVGLQRSTSTFAELTSAPTEGYHVDSVLTVSPGETVIIKAAHGLASQICYLQFATDLYSKVVVDSVNTATRAIYFKITVDPNCGFRSFAQGIPKF